MPTSRVTPKSAASADRLAWYACALASSLFVLLAVLVGTRWSPLASFDRARVLELNRFDARAPDFVSVMRSVSTVASTAVWSIVLGALALWLALRRRWRSVVFVAVATIGSPLLNAMLKSIVHRPRPVLARPFAMASGWSFPSGHAQAATVGCLVLLVVSWPRLRERTVFATCVAAVAVTAVVGAVALSRMSLGVHYPSDIIGSVLCGCAWVLLVERLTAGPRSAAQ